MNAPSTTGLENFAPERKRSVGTVRRHESTSSAVSHPTFLTTASVCVLTAAIVLNVLWESAGRPL